MNIKKISILTIVFVLITVLAITATMLLSDKQPEYDKYMHISGSYTYVSPEDLYKNADLIATCTFTGKSNTVYSDSSYELSETFPVFTDLIFEANEIIKGESDKEIYIRYVGGGKGDTFYVSSGYENFKKGQQYFIYLLKSESNRKDDNTNYIIVGGETGCFEINNNILSNTGRTKEDLQKIQEFYNSAVID